MNNRGLRQQILVRSVKRLIDEDEQIDGVVVMWDRHRWFYPYCIGVGILLLALTTALNFEGWFNRVGVAGSGVAVAAFSTTNYWILARTTAGFVLCRSSRIRQYAKELIRRMDAKTSIEMVGSTVITSDWQVDGAEYTLTKRWEATMRSFTS